MSVPPVAPFGSYFNPTMKQCIWRKYQINEKNRRNEFLNMEIIKITHALILQHIDVMKLMQKGYLQEYYPLHDVYQLKGISKIPFVKALID
jgi:anoctamin-10